MGAVVNCVAYQSGKKVGDIELRRIHEILENPGPFIWIGIHEPEEGLLREVQKEFRLHDLAVEDALCAHERPKVENYENNLFVVLRTAQLNRESKQIEFGETHVFVGERYVVAVRHGASAPYVAVRARIETTPNLLKLGPGFVLYALMDFIVDQYFPIMAALEDDLEEIETAIFERKYDLSITERIHQLQRQLLQMRRSISPLIDVCHRLTRFDTALIPEETRLYFRDVYDHVVRLNEMLDIQRELLTLSLEANLSLISIEQNNVMKQFAGWAALIAIPTMIAGIYGMNFKSMPEIGWPFGYPFAIGLMVVACFLLYMRFKRSGWL